MFEKATKTKTFAKIAAFGDGGTGKTKLILSFPNVYLADTEHGSDPYREKYDFNVKHINRWGKLGELLDWLEKNTPENGTFAIDSLTVFYQDLVNDMVEFVKNRRGHEILSQSEWTIIKRRWAAFLNRLIRLPMHVILSMRERDEYEETTNRQGEDVRRKTGNHLMDADKQTKYIFDLVLRCFTEEDKAKKTSKFLLQVDKTRYDWMPKYSVYNVTKQFVYKKLFQPYISTFNGPAPTPPEPERVDTPPSGSGDAEDQQAAAQADPNAPPSTAENVGAVLRTFAGADPNEPAAKGEDLKVLMTRAGQLKWSDATKFSTKDGKALLKALFKVDSTKDLKKSQVDFLFKQFGEVLADRACLARDEKGVPFIQFNGQSKKEETKSAEPAATSA